MTIKEQEALRLVREAATEAAAAGALPNFLAELERARCEAMLAAATPLRVDETLSLDEAARFMGEVPETFRRRLEYRKAQVSRAGELRLRFSRRELERIVQDRLAGNGA